MEIVSRLESSNNDQLVLKLVQVGLGASKVQGSLGSSDV